MIQKFHCYKQTSITELYFCQVLEGYDPGFCWLLSISLTLAIRYRSMCASQAVLVVENPPANAGRDGDVNLILGLGRSPGEGNGDPHQYSCLGKSRGQRSLGAMVRGGSKSRTRLSDCACGNPAGSSETLQGPC